MKASDGTWDVRCPEELRSLFPKRTGYYFRVDTDTAKKVLHLLADAYGISVPGLGKMPRGREENALYEYDTWTIFLYPRTHLRTVFHEFYHHLDNMTDGRYDSDDRQGGSSSFAWIFADMLWEKFTKKSPDARWKRGEP
jgi:hypothetical protein